jgi:DNA-binding MarR family transcriptional regulator
MTLREFSRKVIDFYPLMLREFARRGDGELLSDSMTMPQMVALHYLEGKTRVAMKEFARNMMIRMSSATVLADRLIAQGMAKRERGDKDRRVVWVAITPKGKKRLTRIVRRKQIVIEEIFGRLSRRERAQYLKIIMKIQSYLRASHEA